MIQQSLALQPLVYPILWARGTGASFRKVKSHSQSFAIIRNHSQSFAIIRNHSQSSMHVFESFASAPFLEYDFSRQRSNDATRGPRNERQIYMQMRNVYANENSEEMRFGREK
jgi:hypothetical protein